MTGAIQHRMRGAAVTAGINICPNMLLGVLILTSLAFVSYMGRSGVVIFLVAGLVLLLRRVDLARAELREYWWLYLLPLWCTASLLWSTHPDLSLRHGIQLVITFLVAVTLANRLSPIMFLRVLFVSLLLAGVASLLFGNVREDGIWVGIFESKNYYAFTMVSLVLCAFALLADAEQPMAWRLAGLLGTVTGLPQILMAASAGALIAVVVVLSAAMLMLAIHALAAAQRLAAVVLLAGLALVLLIVGFYLRDPLLLLLVEVTGKDMSLTGRTDLWNTAISEISRAPILGTGYRAFWVEGNPLAEQIWADFYITAKSGFNFHNLFLSNAIDVGLIGIALHLMLLVPAFLLCIRWLLRTGGAPALFSFAAIAFVIVLSMVEVPVFFEFSALTVMVIAALVYGLRAARELPNLHSQGANRWRT